MVFEDLVTRVALGDRELFGTVPGAFVRYDSVNQKSSEITLASSGGVISKKKKRKVGKTLFEFLALGVWCNLLERYSSANEISFRAPSPIGIVDMSEDCSTLLMEYLPGHEMKKLANLKRRLPVRVPGMEDPVPLFIGAAIHLGALNRLKEVEELCHGDYDDRHVMFHHGVFPYVGVVDVESTKLRGLAPVVRESETTIELLKKRFAAQGGDASVLETWYQEGRAMLVVPDGGPQLVHALEETQRKYNTTLDLEYKRVGGVPVGEDKS